MWYAHAAFSRENAYSASLLQCLLLHGSGKLRRLQRRSLNPDARRRGTLLATDASTPPCDAMTQRIKDQLARLGDLQCSSTASLRFICCCRLWRSMKQMQPATRAMSRPSISDTPLVLSSLQASFVCACGLFSKDAAPQSPAALIQAQLELHQDDAY